MRRDAPHILSLSLAVRPQDAAQAAAQRKLSDAQAAHKLAALADEVAARAKGLLALSRVAVLTR